jgi:hypothetical protein
MPEEGGRADDQHDADEQAGDHRLIRAEQHRDERDGPDDHKEVSHSGILAPASVTAR